MSVDDRIFSAPDDLYDDGRSTFLGEETATVYVSLLDRLDDVEGALIARGGVLSKAKNVFDKLLHPRGRDGRFIEKGGNVVVHTKTGPKRGKVTNISENGIEVDIGGDKPILVKAHDIEQGSKTKATLNLTPDEEANLPKPPEARTMGDKDMAEREARMARLRARVHPELTEPDQQDVSAQPKTTGPEGQVRQLRTPMGPPGQIEPGSTEALRARVHPAMSTEDRYVAEPTPIPEEDLDPDVANLEVSLPMAGQITGGTGTKEDPYITANVDAAVQLLAADKYVQLNQPDEVATLLDELKAIADDAKKKGESAPDYDLCKVSIPGTNLFCHDHKGIPRIQMPQLSGKPTPGSKADLLPKDKKGEVDIGPLFIEHLQAKGISVTEKSVPADHLRASQNQLVGTKVAGMAAAMEEGVMPPGSIFTTRDNYVVDGHHRWAATIGVEYSTGTPMNQDVKEIDLDILAALAEANAFAVDVGIPPKAGSGGGTEGVGPALAVPLA